MARFNRDECPTRASALAFSAIFALLPCILLALAAIGVIAGDPHTATDKLASYLAQFVPGRDSAKTVRDILEQAHVAEAAQSLTQGSVLTGVIGVLTQLWTGTGLMVATTVPLNIVWGTPETRNPFVLRVTGLAVFVCASLLFLLTLPLSAGPELVQNWHLLGLSLPKPPPIWIGGFFKLLALVFGTLFFALIYGVLPAVRVRPRIAFIAGAAASILWELFKTLFAVYLAHAGNGNKVYGAFGGVAFMVTWVGYTCILLLAGGILCRMLDERAGRSAAREKAPEASISRNP